MPSYHRILVSYPIAESADWSAPHWCDIELDENQVVHVRVAPATRDGAMPGQEQFLELGGISSRKLRVFDFTDETNPTYCLGLAYLVDPTPYFQGVSKKIKDLPPLKLYRFDFNAHTSMLPGRPWSPVGDDEWTADGSITVANVYKYEPSKDDKRLGMKGYVDYTQIQSDLVNDREQFEAQYTAWNNENADAARQAQLEEDERFASDLEEKEEEKRQKDILARWEKKDRNEVILNSDDIDKNSLNEYQIDEMTPVV